MTSLDTPASTAPDAFPADREDVLASHVQRLTDMAEEAEKSCADAATLARAWSDAAEVHQRLARGYRKALEYLEAQARAEAARPGDRA